MGLLTRPGLLLRIEGAALFGLSVWLFSRLDVTWILFAVLILAPDLTFAAYLRGPKFGAEVYNLVHLAAWPAALAAIGLVTGLALVLAIALIWLAHIGMDRMMAFGFKYPTGFRDTHLSRV